MDQHPVPRQITTFEFKLIGFMTLRQFLYLVVFLPLGYIIATLFPVPILNIFIGILTAAAGFILAFVPINDRPIDVWIKNFINKLTSPTQYFFHKQNKPLYFLQALYFQADPHKVFAHIESQEKLAQYLASKKTNPDIMETLHLKRKKEVGQLLQQEPHTLQPQVQKAQVQQPQSTPVVLEPQSPKKPFVAGVVKNNRKIPLPGILIYIKDTVGKPLRLLKTNPHGVFATYTDLNPGEYTFDIKDPKGTFFFDTMNLKIDHPVDSLEFYSKELI